MSPFFKPSTCIVWHLTLPIWIAVFILSGCQAATPIPTPTTTTTPTLTPSLAASATQEPLPTAPPPPIPSPTSQPSPTATSTPLPKLPAGQPLPALEIINYANADRLAALASWRESSVADLTWSPNSELLAIGTDELIKMYGLATRELAHTIDSGPGVTSLVFSPRFNFLAAGFRLGNETEGFAGNIDFWRVSNWEKLGSLYGDYRAVSQVAFAPGGQTFAAAFTTPLFNQDSVIVWETTNWEITRTLQTDNVLEIAFSPDGKILATSPDRYSVKIWRLEDAQRIQVLETAFSDAVSAMAFSPNGTVLATGHYDGRIQLWDVAKGSPLISMQPGGVISSLAFNRDGSLLASGDGYEAYHLFVWDAETGLLLRELDGHAHAIDSLAFAPNSRLLVSASFDGSVILWAVR